MASEDPTSERDQIGQSKISLESRQFYPMTSRAGGPETQKRNLDRVMQLQDGMLVYLGN